MKKLICLVLLLSLLSCLLCGCADSAERAWRSGQKALAEEKFDVAITSFQKAGSFQDAERLLLYAQASQELAVGNYENAEAGFRALGDFKDSILMTSSRSSSTTLISSDSSRCCSDRRSTPTAMKVWLLLVQAPALGLTVMRWLHSPPP